MHKCLLRNNNANNNGGIISLFTKSLGGQKTNNKLSSLYTNIQRYNNLQQINNNNFNHTATFIYKNYHSNLFNPFYFKNKSKKHFFQRMKAMNTQKEEKKNTSIYFEIIKDLNNNENKLNFLIKMTIKSGLNPNVYNEIKYLYPFEFDEIDENGNILLFYKYSYYHELITILKETFPDLTIDTIPEFAFELLEYYNLNTVDISKINLRDHLPSHLYHHLMPFQKEGILFSISKMGRILLYDEMGLGKTIQAIGMACYFKKDWPVLIVTPSSLTNNWKSELNKWIDKYWLENNFGKQFQLFEKIRKEEERKDEENKKLNAVEGDGNIEINVEKKRGRKRKNDKKEQIIDNNTIEPFICLIESSEHLNQLQNNNNNHYLIYIISYDLLAKNISTDKKENKFFNQFKVVIGDESHKLKNDVTQKVKRILPILNNSKRVFLLSGTGTPSRPIELYTQLKAVVPNYIQLKKYEFGERYCDLQATFFTMADYRGNRLLSELNLILTNSLMIRRLKADVLDLPSKNRYLIDLSNNHMLNLNRNEDILDYNTSVNWLYNFNQKNKKKRIKIGDFDNNLELIQQYTFASRIKLKPVRNYVRTLLEKGEKFIIFGHHSKMLDAIENEINLFLRENPEINWNYIRIDGTTPTRVRQDLCNKYREDDNCIAGILSISAAGYGLNFIPCQTVVFAELFWNPGTLEQCEDRCHRIGMKNEIDVKYLFMKGTVDEIIWNLISNKIDVVSETLNGMKIDENSNHLIKTTRQTNE
ncbi:hypothetical protein ABK040_015212 [Willaertia magna]